MTFSAVVPARLGSTRLPDKPLADIGGTPMVVHVLMRAREAGAGRVVCATDSQRIADAAGEAGFEAALTGECASGTERVARAAESLGLEGVVVNLQGDEPDIDPRLIADVARRAQEGGCQCATAAGPIDAGMAGDPHVVKVVVGADGRALYFSRSAIPHGAREFLGHIGIYAFAPGLLAGTLDLAPAGLERAERLEQLRWLWHGWRIDVVVADRFSRGIDTPAELAEAQGKAG